MSLKTERNEACVTDVSSPFSRRENRANKRANERTWGEQKIEGGKGGGTKQKRTRRGTGGKGSFFASPPATAPYFVPVFRTGSQFLNYIPLAYFWK